jgi:hypothetical protein
MSKFNNFEVTSIAGAITSIGASLTLERVGVIVGIFTALVTCAINALYMFRKDRREERELDAQLEGK